MNYLSLKQRHSVLSDNIYWLNLQKEIFWDTFNWPVQLGELHCIQSKVCCETSSWRKNSKGIMAPYVWKFSEQETGRVRHGERERDWKCLKVSHVKAVWFLCHEGRCWLCSSLLQSFPFKSLMKQEVAFCWMCFTCHLCGSGTDLHCLPLKQKSTAILSNAYFNILSRIITKHLIKNTTKRNYCALYYSSISIYERLNVATLLQICLLDGPSP